MIAPRTLAALAWLALLLALTTPASGIAAPTHPYPGAELDIVLVQDATGGRTVGWSSGFKRNWTPDMAAGKRNTYEFLCVGTNQWMQVGGWPNI